MNTSVTKLLAAVFILAGVALSTTHTQAAAQAAKQETASKTAAKKDHPPLPAKLFEQYIQALKQTPEYKLARAYNPKQVKEVTEKWDCKSVSVFTMPFREIIGSHTLRVRVTVKLPNGDKADLRYFKTNDRVIINDRILLEIEKDDSSKTTYQLSNSQLDNEALNFETVFSLSIQFPQVRLERFTAENQSLATVFKDLCGRINLDYSFREDLARPVQVTLDVRDRSIVECLELIAYTSGWKLTYKYSRGFRDNYSYNTSVKAYGYIEHNRIDPDVDPMELLEQNYKKGKDLIRPTVILSPPAGVNH